MNKKGFIVAYVVMLVTVLIVTNLQKDTLIATYGPIAYWCMVFVLIGFAAYVAMVPGSRTMDNKVASIREMFVDLEGSKKEIELFRVKLVETELRAKRHGALLTKIINTIPNIIMVRDSRGRVEMINQYGAKFFRTTPEKAIGWTIRELIGEGGNFGAGLVLAEQTMVKTLEPVMFMEDGIIFEEYVTLRVVMSPLVGANGELEASIYFAYSNIEFLKTMKQVVGELDTGEAEIAKTTLVSLLKSNYISDGRVPEILKGVLKGGING